MVPAFLADVREVVREAVVSLPEVELETTSRTLLPGTALEHEHEVEVCEFSPYVVRRYLGGSSEPEDAATVRKGFLGADAARANECAAVVREVLDAIPQSAVGKLRQWRRKFRRRASSVVVGKQVEAGGGPPPASTCLPTTTAQHVVKSPSTKVEQRDVLHRSSLSSGLLVLDGEVDEVDGTGPQLNPFTTTATSVPLPVVVDEKALPSPTSSLSSNMSNCSSSGRERSEEPSERMEVALFEDAAFWEELQPWETACETKQVRIKKFVEAILRRDTSSVDSSESSCRPARGLARASSASTARYLDYCQLDEACGRPCGAAGPGGVEEEADFSADQRRKARLLQAKLFRPVVRKHRSSCTRTSRSRSLQESMIKKTDLPPEQHHQRQLFVGENKEEDDAQLLLGESLPCLWAGTAGSSSRLHYDTTGTNYILQLHGRKRWLLFPPNAPPAPAAEAGTSRVVLMPETRLPFEETTVFSHGAVGDSLAEYVESYRLIDRERRRLVKKIQQLDDEDVEGDDPRFVQGVPGGARAGIAGGKATKTKTKSPQLRSTSWERASCSAQEQQQQQRQHEDDTSTSGVIDEEDHVDEDVIMEDCEQQDPSEQRPLAAPPSEASLLLEMQLQRDEHDKRRRGRPLSVGQHLNRPLTVLLNPGDLLFLPRHWWHATIAVDKACLALNQWVPHPLDSHAKKTESLCRCLVGALATRYAEHLQQGGAAGGAGVVGLNLNKRKDQAGRRHRCPPWSLEEAPTSSSSSDCSEAGAESDVEAAGGQSSGSDHVDGGGTGSGRGPAQGQVRVGGESLLRSTCRKRKRKKAPSTAERTSTNRAKGRSKSTNGALRRPRPREDGQMTRCTELFGVATHFGMEGEAGGEDYDCPLGEAADRLLHAATDPEVLALISRKLSEGMSQPPT